MSDEKTYHFITIATNRDLFRLRFLHKLKIHTVSLTRPEGHLTFCSKISFYQILQKNYKIYTNLIVTKA
jgi:hypothetical protein